MIVDMREAPRYKTKAEILNNQLPVISPSGGTPATPFSIHILQSF
jgi:hypothetical protein